MRNSNPEFIDKKLGCGPESRMSYYDQARITGLDLRQAPFANAKVLLDKDSNFTDTCQGSYRMRGLADEQTIEILCPINLPDHDFESIIARCIENERRQLRQENFSAAQAKMTNIIRNDLLQRILALPSEQIKEKKHYATIFKKYFVETAQRDTFEKYGHVSIQTPAAEILLAHKAQLLTDWQQMLASVEPDIDLANLYVKIDEQCDAIIKETIPICDQEYLKPTQQDLGLGMECQKEVELEVQQEIQVDKQFHNPKMEPERLDNVHWDIVAQITNAVTRYPRQFAPALLREQLLSLTHLCELQGANNPPVFEQMYVTNNFYKTYKGQKQFLDPFLKPVYGLLFLKTPDAQVLSCVILSQCDLSKIITVDLTHLTGRVWVTTTQHTLLYGTPPDNLENNSHYLKCIEQARYFNGEVAGLIAADMPLQWLEQDSGRKIAFFEQYLMHNRAVASPDVKELRAILSKRSHAFDYIVAHPFADYNSEYFSWRSEVSLELTDEDIEQALILVSAIQYANQNWPIEIDDTNNPYKNKLSLQARGRLEGYYKVLASLKTNMLILCDWVKAPESDDFYSSDVYYECIDQVLENMPSYFITEGFPGDVPERNSIMHHIVQNYLGSTSTLISQINVKKLLYAVQKLGARGLRINALNKDGYTVWEYLIPHLEPDAFPYVFEKFVDHHANISIQIRVLRELSLAQLNVMKNVPSFAEDMAYLGCYLFSVLMQQLDTGLIEAEIQAILGQLIQNGGFDRFWQRLDELRYKDMAKFQKIMTALLDAEELATPPLIDELLRFQSVDSLDLSLILLQQKNFHKICKTRHLSQIIETFRYSSTDNLVFLMTTVTKYPQLTSQHIARVLEYYMRILYVESDKERYQALLDNLLQTEIFQTSRGEIIDILLSSHNMDIDSYLLSNDTIQPSKQQLCCLLARYTFTNDFELQAKIVDRLVSSDIDEQVINHIFIHQRTIFVPESFALLEKIANATLKLNRPDLLMVYLNAIQSLPIPNWQQLCENLVVQVQSLDADQAEIVAVIIWWLGQMPEGRLLVHAQFLAQDPIREYYLQSLLLRDDLSVYFWSNLLNQLQDIPDAITLKVLRHIINSANNPSDFEEIPPYLLANQNWHLLTDAEIVTLFSNFDYISKKGYFYSNVYSENHQRINSILLELAPLEVCNDIIEINSAFLSPANITQIYIRLNTAYLQQQSGEPIWSRLLSNLLQKQSTMEEFEFDHLALDIGPIIVGVAKLN